jgi:uncharacterized RDD family membrane protein YckC
MARIEAWPRAGLWRRLASIGYDLLLVLALMMALTAAVLLIRGGDAIGAGAVWFQLLLLACWWLYFAWSWSRGGQTVGMRAWRMRLTRPDGSAVDWRRASLRFAAAALSALALGLGFAWTLVDRRGLSWHDRLSGTELRVEPPKPGSKPAKPGSEPFFESKKGSDPSSAPLQRSRKTATAVTSSKSPVGAHAATAGSSTKTSPMLAETWTST